MALSATCTGTKTHRHRHRRLLHNSSTHGHTAPAGLIPDDDHEEEEEEDSKDFVVCETKRCRDRNRKKLESSREIQQLW